MKWLTLLDWCDTGDVPRSPSHVANSWSSASSKSIFSSTCSDQWSVLGLCVWVETTLLNHKHFTATPNMNYSSKIFFADTFTPPHFRSQYYSFYTAYCIFNICFSCTFDKLQQPSVLISMTTVAEVVHRLHPQSYHDEGLLTF